MQKTSKNHSIHTDLSRGWWGGIGESGKQSSFSEKEWQHLPALGSITGCCHHLVASRGNTALP